MGIKKNKLKKSKRIRFKKNRILLKYIKNKGKAFIAFMLILIIIILSSIHIIFKKNKNNHMRNPNKIYNSHKINISIKNNENLYWNSQTSLEIDKVIEDIKELNNGKISYENKEDFKKRENPKVSLVIALYNQENNIKSIYASILKQEMKDIEIIFVNDASKDNSEKIVKELMEKDERIVYIKNEINKRAFYSRNRGILSAKGEYILIIDPDDLLINNILIKAYETSKEYDLDIVQFYIMVGYRHSPNLWRELKYTNGILKTNSDIRNIFYYGISRNLFDKLIKREVYVNSVKFMKEELWDENYRINDDDTAFFGIVHVARSYGFLEQIGYFYIIRPPGSYDINNANNADEMFRSIFNIMKYFYLQSDNNTLEKSKMAYEYFEKSMNAFGKFIPYVKNGFDFIFNVFELYLNSPYFNEAQKSHLNEYKNKFLNVQKNK